MKPLHNCGVICIRCTTQSIAKSFELKLQLQISHKGGLTCAQFLQHMQSIADRLRSIESEVSDHELVLYTLQGLGSDFESFVTVVSMRETPPSMVELQGLLLAHEARIQANLRSHSASMPHLTTQLNSLSLHNSSSSTSSDTSALYAGKHPPNQHQSWQNSNQSRYNSNRGRGYRGRGRRRNSNFSKDKDVQCQICFRRGHPAGKCYHRFDLTYSGTPHVFVTSTSGVSSQDHQVLGVEPTATPSLQWFLDSCASTHVTSDLNCLSSSEIYNGTDQVQIGNGAGLSISHTGTAYLKTSGQSLILTNVLYVPTITKNLLSISQLIRDNVVLVQFSPTSCFIKDQATQQVLLHGTLHKGLYYLAGSSTHFQAFHASHLSSDVWHNRMCHCSSSLIDFLR
jgi:gag-polypeptide of LTR copia-type